MAKGILIAAMNIGNAAEDEFHDWYDTEHVPERQRVPGFLLCQRWIGVADPKVSVATYDLDTIGVPSATPHQASRPLRVAVFPSDILTFAPDASGCYGNFYTLGYALEFLRACARLALEHPDLEFTVKTKHAEHVDLVLEDAALGELVERARDNFHFVRQARGDYAQLLFDADIVLAIGFTTPGVEGLLLGKPLIYYSRIEHDGHAFAGLPGTVAESEEELRALFAEVRRDPQEYARRHQAQITRLDPFRDGAARERIHTALGIAEEVQPAC